MKQPGFALVLATTLGGCCCYDRFPMQRAFLINASDATLAVSVSMPRAVIEPEGPLANCRLDRSEQPIMIGSADDLPQRRFANWPPALLTEYDPEKCTATIAVLPDMALLMFMNGPCSNYENAQYDPRLMPTIDRLSITGGGRSILLAGSDTAEAFKTSRWRSDCRFVIN